MKYYYRYCWYYSIYKQACQGNVEFTVISSLIHTIYRKLTFRVLIFTVYGDIIRLQQ
nr:MAG TPA: hypothetical protein [Bacteriophage sp.]